MGFGSSSATFPSSELTDDSSDTVKASEVQHESLQICEPYVGEVIKLGKSTPVEGKEAKCEAPPTQSTEGKVQRNGRVMVADEPVNNNYMVDSETRSFINKFIGLIDIIESITNEQQKAEFFFSNVDELRRIIAELEKVGCNVVPFTKWVDVKESMMILVDEMESSKLLLSDCNEKIRDCDEKISDLNKGRKEAEEKLAYVQTRLAEIKLEGELLAEMSLSRFFRYVLLFFWCVVGCVLVKYLC